MNEVLRTARGIAWRADGPAASPALLLLGSLGTTSDIWQPQLAAFTPALRVIRLDTRGHGTSDSPPGEYTLDDLGADALSVLDAAGVERAAVCGVSLGGMTAMWLAAHAPERVRALLAVSTALKVPWVTELEWRTEPSARSYTTVIVVVSVPVSVCMLLAVVTVDASGNEVDDVTVAVL